MTHRTERIEEGITRHYRSDGRHYLYISTGHKDRKYLRIPDGTMTDELMDEAREIRAAMPPRKDRKQAKPPRIKEPTQSWKALSGTERYQPKMQSQRELW